MIFFNDRRKAKKASSATTRTQLGQMAKSGALRSAGSARFAGEGHAERQEVAYEANHGVSSRPVWRGQQLTRGDRFKAAAQAFDTNEKASKVKPPSKG